MIDMTASQRPATTAPLRLTGLDLLRLFAAMAVVFFHYCFRGAAGDGFMSVTYHEVSWIAEFGYIGVNLFFAISGFVIIWSAQGQDWTRFSVGRVARLYPAFFACMTATFLVLSISPLVSVAPGPMDYLANLIIFSPALGVPFVDGVYWTIVFEIVFYGWVALGLMTGILPRYLLAALSVWLMIILANEHILQLSAIKHVFVTRFGTYFILGALVYHIWQHGWSRFAAALLVVAWVQSFHAADVERVIISGLYSHTFNGVVIAILNALILPTLCVTIWASKFIKPSAWVVAAGAITYPLYLIHQNIGYVMICSLTPILGKWSALALTITVMLLASYLVWKWIEKPVGPWLKRTLNGLLIRFRLQTPHPVAAE